MTAYRILGIILTVVGIAATAMPSWFAFITGAGEPTVDLFEAVERRVRGGMVLGVGLALIGVTALRPWSTSIPLAIFYVVTGALVARVVGIMIHGAVPKQWMLMAVEALIMAVVALWLWRSALSAS